MSRGSSNEFSVENGPVVGSNQQAYNDQVAIANQPSAASSL
jgi:hypothetical protein